MANLELEIEIKNANKDEAIAAFQRINPMPKVKNPDVPGAYMDKFPNVKAHAEAVLQEMLLRILYQGQKQLIADSSEPLNTDIFV